MRCQPSACVYRAKFQLFSETQWSTAPFSESETFRREKKKDLHYAYNAGRMLIVMMMMMNKRLIVVTWQSSRSPWPETIPPPPIPIVQTPYSRRIHFTSSWLSFNIPIVQTTYSQRILCTSSWSSFNLQSCHCRTLFVAKNCLFTWLITCQD